ncbi:MAG: protein O-mannosyl-transferase family [Anaerolineae bacterium]
MRRPEVLTGAAALLIALIVYLTTLDNGLRLEELKGGDLITHQYAQVQARPSNAPGYPLYTMLGWLWFRLGRFFLSPFFNPTEILSLYSTIWALAALATLYILILETTGGNWLVAGLSTIFFSITYFFWYYSVSTEQYTSAVFQTLLIVLFAFRWEKSREESFLLWLALLVGTALANLITVLLILPPLLIFILSAEPGLLRRFRLWAKSAALLALPLLSYVYVYVRGAQHPEWRGAGLWPSAWAWFISFITTQQGRDELTWTLGPFTEEFPWLIAWEMTIPGLAIALIGVALLGVRRASFLYGTFLLYFIFCYIDRYGNWYQVIIPVYPLLVLGMAVSADWLWRKGRAWRALAALALVALIAGRLYTMDARVLQRNRPDDDALLPGRAILEDHPAPNAAVVGDYEEYLSLKYLTEIWGERADVKALRFEEAADALAEGKRPLYLTRAAAPLILGNLPAVALSGAGMRLITVNAEPQFAPPPMAHPSGEELGGALRLLGYDWRMENGEGFSMLHLSLYWQAVKKMDFDYAISVRPTLAGQVIFVEGRLLQRDVPHPVWGNYPTSRWQPGEVVRDDHLIPLPPGQTCDGAKVVVYRVVDGSFENLGEIECDF